MGRRVRSQSHSNSESKRAVQDIIKSLKDDLDEGQVESMRQTMINKDLHDLVDLSDENVPEEEAIVYQS